MTVMPYEDLRGRHFTWQVQEDTVALIEDPVVIGQLVRLSERLAYLAEIVGERLIIEHSVGVLGPTFQVRDTATEAVLAASHYTREAEMRAVLGNREYALRRSGTIAVWNDGVEDAVSLREGEAFVLMGADPNDAAPLLLLGIVMSLENFLFPAPRVRGF